ncbi:MAG: cobalamin-binding protein [Sphingobium sp.]|uniref:cobalamin-binding protein n=1 Tax=Sphingobium sp. TaxID=1912891 RepID=UPI0029BEE26C|nr:cobalamin-binding protein [Sphingobium sp.]MDX3910086.1 cobalamin-binding protein [Sphingobium sp.]
MTVQPRRIVSLLPSATEIAVSLGFGGELVGRSHECDWPASVEALPPITASKLAKGLKSGEIELRVQEIVASGLSVYEVDGQRLRDLEPDVILTQTQCAVCAVTPADLEEAIAAWTGKAPVLISLAPDDLADVWGDFARVGAALNAEDRAGEVVAELKARMAAIGAAVADRPKPRVAAIEWLDPLMVAGNWVPELIEAAGGESVLATPGQHSPWIEWEQLSAADPDRIVLMPCGFRIEQALAELPALAADPRWQSLRAVRDGQVYATDGQYFFNRPGPRLVESAEILAEICHRDAVSYGHEGAAWVRVAS